MKKFALMATVAAAVWVIAVTVIMLSVDGDYGGEKDVFAVDMVFVESGTFMMGCTAEQQGDDCEHIEKKGTKRNGRRLLSGKIRGNAGIVEVGNGQKSVLL